MNSDWPSSAQAPVLIQSTSVQGAGSRGGCRGLTNAWQLAESGATVSQTGTPQLSPTAVRIPLGGMYVAAGPGGGDPGFPVSAGTLKVVKASPGSRELRDTQVASCGRGQASSRKLKGEGTQPGPWPHRGPRCAAAAGQPARAGVLAQGLPGRRASLLGSRVVI